MKQCWINEKCPLTTGQVIKIVNGNPNDIDNTFRVTRFYFLPHNIPYPSWDDNDKRSLDKPIIGLVKNVKHKSNNQTYFSLYSIKEGLPPFNIDEGTLTNTFISSKIDELKCERLQSAIGIFNAKSKPVYWEGFEPSVQPPKEHMIEKLDECHIYVGIFGIKYSESTILEYNRAEQLERQRLCFVKKTKNREPKLTDFLKKIQNKVTYRSFTSADELKTLVQNAVETSIKKLFV